MWRARSARGSRCRCLRLAPRPASNTNSTDWPMPRRVWVTASMMQQAGRSMPATLPTAVGQSGRLTRAEPTTWSYTVTRTYQPRRQRTTSASPPCRTAMSQSVSGQAAGKALPSSSHRVAGGRPRRSGQVGKRLQPRGRCRRPGRIRLWPKAVSRIRIRSEPILPRVLILLQ